MIKIILLHIFLLLDGATVIQAEDSASFLQQETTKLDDWFENLDITPDIVDKLASDNKTVVAATALEVLKTHLQKKGISLTLSPEEARFKDLFIFFPHRFIIFA